MDEKIIKFILILIVISVSGAALYYGTKKTVLPEYSTENVSLCESGFQNVSLVCSSSRCIDSISGITGSERIIVKRPCSKSSDSWIVEQTPCDGGTYTETLTCNSLTSCDSYELNDVNAWNHKTYKFGEKKITIKLCVNDRLYPPEERVCVPFNSRNYRITSSCVTGPTALEGYTIVDNNIIGPTCSRMGPTFKQGITAGNQEYCLPHNKIGCWQPCRKPYSTNTFGIKYVCGEYVPGNDVPMRKLAYKHTYWPDVKLITLKKSDGFTLGGVCTEFSTFNEKKISTNTQVCNIVVDILGNKGFLKSDSSGLLYWTKMKEIYNSNIGIDSSDSEQFIVTFTNDGYVTIKTLDGKDTLTGGYRSNITQPVTNIKMINPKTAPCLAYIN